MAVNILKNYVPHSYQLNQKNVPRRGSGRYNTRNNLRMVTCSAGTHTVTERGSDSHRPAVLSFDFMQSLKANNSAERRSAEYQPSIWSYDSFQSLDNDQAVEIYKDKAKELEEQVRSLINIEKQELLTVIEHIDNIQRLGMGYRFEQDIRRALHGFVSLGGLDATAQNNLHATALSFRLLKQHGYEVSQDVFSKFMDQDGKFMDCLHEDVQGMLNLYEAAYFGFEDETILERAKEFATLHLKNFRGKVDRSLEEQVNHALELPLNRWTQRLEALWSIEAYSQRKDANEALLELATMDFNMVQSVLKKDLSDMSRWWRGIGLANKLEFARDRLMECFFWSVGMVFEPQYSYCRKELTKVVALITILDDVYDVYGTLDELKLFTDAVQRWDVNAIDTLPDYMKLCFLALYNTVNEMGYESLKERGLNILPYLTKAWANLCKSFLQEAKWFYSRETPMLMDYYENGWRSSSGPLLLVHACLFLSENVTDQELEGLENYHGLLRWPSFVFRLCNDLVSASAEMERGETANAVSCYMRKTGVAEEPSKEHISNLIDETWKRMNKERVNNSIFGKPFIETAINLARTAHCTYQYGDAHSNPDERQKKRVLSVLIEPIMA